MDENVVGHPEKILTIMMHHDILFWSYQCGLIACIGDKPVLPENDSLLGS